MKKRIVLLTAAAAMIVPAVVVIIEGDWQNLPVPAMTQLLGLWGLVLLLMQFILTSRVRLLDRWIGLDRLVHAHRIIGMAALITIFVHMLPYTISTITSGGFPGDILNDLPIAMGSFAFQLLLIVGLTAIFYRKLRLRYEIWRAIHQVSYIILPLVLLHGINAGTHLPFHPVIQGQMSFMTGIVAILLATRLYRTVYSRLHPQQITEVQPATHDTTSVRFTRPHNFPAIAGQFVIIRFKGRELKESPHPFTLSSGTDSDYLEITAKSVGDFTGQIQLLHTGDTVYIDGPFGIFQPLPSDQEPVLWIAGGIGITPFLSALRSLDGRQHPPITLIWGNKTPADICYADELAKYESQNPNLRIMHVFSQSPGNGAGFGESYGGYVSADIIASAIGESSPRTCLCGPPVMRKALLALLKQRGITVEYEKFDL